MGHIRKMGLWVVDGEWCSLDEMLEAYVDRTRFSPPDKELFDAAVEMENIRGNARARQEVPPAPLSWLPALNRIQEAVR